MKVLVTGSAGRVGRTIYITLMNFYDVVGIDITPCSTADYVGDIRDSKLIAQALEGIDVVIHCAALHAPHVSLRSEEEFKSIKSGVKHFIFTSTTALYGYASTPQGVAGWVNEQVTPQPKSIYHRSKIAAEKALQDIANLFNLPVTVLQISRCFPEPADLMATYRLTRGIDARDIATAHLQALKKRPRGFNRFIISGATPFTQSDCQKLYSKPGIIIKEKCPNLAAAFEQRGWSFPSMIDRVYDSNAAQQQLDWTPKYGFESVLDMLDNNFAEVMPVK